MAEGKKWFLRGCLGCLGIVAFVLVIGAVIAGAAFFQVRQEQVEQHASSQELPVTAPEATGTETLALSQAAGQIYLELARAEFEVEPLPPGEQMRVEATYDKRSHELVESMERGEGGEWTYRVRFGSSGSNVMAALRQLFGGTQPKVRVFLPVDVPMSLDIDLDQGGGRVDLGGMWLTEVDLRLDKGGFQVDVDEPLRQPLERMTLHGAMGGMQVSRLGNASPRQLEIDFAMGGLELDLRGNWVTDSEIRLRASMGGTVLRLPRDVIIEGLDGEGFHLPKEAEIPPPTLKFDVFVTRGEMEIIP